MDEPFLAEVEPMPEPDPSIRIEPPSSGGFRDGLLSSVYDTAGNIFDAAIDLVGEALRGFRNGFERMTFGGDIISPHDVAVGIHGPSDERGTPDISGKDLYGSGQAEIGEPDQPTGSVYGQHGVQEPPDTLGMSHAELSAALYGARDNKPDIEPPAPEPPPPTPDR